MKRSTIMLYKDGRYYIGPISYTMPENMIKVNDLNTVYCASLKDSEHAFDISTETSYSLEDAKTFLTLAFNDDEVEPLGDIMSISVNGLSGYYLDCYLPLLKSVHREFCFDIPDEDFNSFSVVIITKNEKDLRYALQSEAVASFFENLRMESRAGNAR